MKTKFFKIVLPAFALMLAITASLAFTSADSAEDLLKITVAEYERTDIVCTVTNEVECQLTGNELCTIVVQNDAGENVVVNLYLVTTNCTVILYEYIPE
ncbi:DUF6520 family protein [Flavivirga aquimarina]|uniref:DUF6520 family protein n=1 Tax=Flavivirga aquimarina TaxID=2027862 RepID=A0ABT8WDI5_9FLAO|nr:DUF6520 family protein [Flavivirga aquimarina]MDO5971215.1 DUF6520 family protein [Flavivirga aquimarina]